MLSLLSPELREQFSGMGDDTLLILPGKKKSKAKSKKELPPLTPQEIKAAKAQYKNTQRKLNQLEQRRRQKEVRSGLYRQLEEHTLLQKQPPASTTTTAITSKEGKETAIGTSNNNITITAKDAQGLLLKSSELGKKVTKKERLKQLRRKEALGIKLTAEERDVLYVKCDAPSSMEFPGMEQLPGGGGKSRTDDDGAGEQFENEKVGGKKKRKTKKQSKGDKCSDNTTASSDGGKTKEAMELATKIVRIEGETVTESAASKRTKMEAQEQSTAAAESSVENKPIETNQVTNSSDTTKPNQSFSEMMFAGLKSLKTKTDTRNEELANKKARKREEDEERAMKLEEEERKRRKVYIPTETVKVSTMHRMLDDASNVGTSKATNDDDAKKRNNVVQRINRPASIEESRYNLPVSTMEYEIIDAVRSNDCTIVCGETGSGKSTQVPQFLYEAGFSTSGWWKRATAGVVGDNSNFGDQSSHLQIGITQPRRVAAISTAKRVCFEMGTGNGQSIANNNLVAYQTRYETAGLGRATHVKFMTDGILLQEIQSDLLLRKYGAIVIDEAHERNLNTDVLLGLLSVALPLRRKAAEEGSLPPLKLVVMSATLKVEDFTENERLFPDGSQRPALVKVPGRTHPVSIHHSKVTELDDYGECCVLIGEVSL